MLFQKYLDILDSIDPGKIYVENVRSFMKVSSQKARTFCEMAVRENLFVRKTGVVCPNDGRIIEEYNDETQMPDEISCSICDAEGKEPCIFKTQNLKKVIFYKLTK